MEIMKRLKDLIIKIINTLDPQFFIRRHRRKVKKLFYKKHAHLKRKHKIIYALTPPPKLSNIGDQAQVVAIYKWFEDNYPDTSIIEVNKDECTSMIKPLKKIVKPNDLIFIHSGGNLGDRGMWSETGRRTIILNFPKNKIISLPQTIFFSDTEKGQQEKLNSARIYNSHKNLTIIGRDLESGKIASEMFPNCKTFSIPDFVLYLKASNLLQSRNSIANGTLFCLRQDNESVLTTDIRNQITEAFELPHEEFDTTIENEIQSNERESYLKETLEYFDQFKIIVTDRYHGLIFAAILEKPTIVLPTIDHKLTSAINWFEELSYIKFINLDEIHKIDHIKSELISTNYKQEVYNWKEKFFDPLAKRI